MYCWRVPSQKWSRLGSFHRPQWRICPLYRFAARKQKSAQSAGSSGTPRKNGPLVAHCGV